MRNNQIKLNDGEDCPSGCGGYIWWLADRKMFVCQSCSKSYDKLAPVPKSPVHERPIAYIAGALSDMCWDYLKNVRNMILWSDKINALGYAVFVPGLDLLCGIATNDWDYTKAFANSQPFLAKSDIVFVCPGWEYSKGTKRELETACDLNIQIYYGGEGYEQLQRDKDLAPGMRGISHSFDDDNELRPFKDLHDSATAELESRKKLPYMTADEGTCDDHVGPDAPVSINDNKCCGTCRYYEEINKFDSGASGGNCHHIPKGLSWAYARLKPETHSDYGKDCDVWETKYRC